MHNDTVAEGTGAAADNLEGIGVVVDSVGGIGVVADSWGGHDSGDMDSVDVGYGAGSQARS